jgi:hypothetical protein
MHCLAAEKEQGLVQYGLTLVLVVVIVTGIRALRGPSIATVFNNVLSPV